MGLLQRHRGDGDGGDEGGSIPSRRLPAVLYLTASGLTLRGDVPPHFVVSSAGVAPAAAVTGGPPAAVRADNVAVATTVAALRPGRRIDAAAALVAHPHS